tara:strand:+ start:407 stop:928 length:522 start_codon:yes stop_codon:yes gene_type:complete
MSDLTQQNNTTGNTGSPQVGSGQANLALTPTVPDPSSQAVETNAQLQTSNLSQTVFDKQAFNETIDTEFSELGNTNTPDPSFFDVDLATQQDFFTLYDKFFFDIPKEGDTDSHTYLVQTSGDYVNFERDQAALKELLDEIADLRGENVKLRIDKVNLEVKVATTESALAAANG